jgi:hypothetical protein
MINAQSGAQDMSRHNEQITSPKYTAEAGCVAVSAVLFATGSALAGGASGAPIFDLSFFDTEPAVYIDFETDGSGAPVNLLDGQTLTMPAAEYADYDPENLHGFTTGVTFSPQVNWVNDGNLFDNILDAFASPQNGISSADIDLFELAFSSPVTSFGLWVADNNSIGTGTQPIFTIKDTQGQIIEVLDFNGLSGAFHDGTFDVGGSIVNYGFMGYAINPQSQVTIGSVEIQKGESIFDDLTFVPVPAPSTLALSALTGIYALRRRR